MRRLRAAVFDNPFGSFQNTVAEAKEERERLDRLLTVSTQRERLLLAIAALLLLVLAIWLFAGNVTRSVAMDGVLVGPGENPAASDRTVQAFVWVGNGRALHIEPGMAAEVELAAADGEAVALDGEVAEVSAVPPSDALAAFEAAAPVSMYRMEIALEEETPGLASLAGATCRIVVVLGKQSPVELFRMRRL